MNLDSFPSQFSFSNVVTRKFVRSTFERSLIFKFEMLAILKFDCSKFYSYPIFLICYFKAKAMFDLESSAFHSFWGNS